LIRELDPASRAYYQGLQGRVQLGREAMYIFARFLGEDTLHIFGGLPGPYEFFKNLVLEEVLVEQWW
jgi:hypothetical protein